MEEQPGILVIHAQRKEELSADRASLAVEVRGSSLFTGRAALKKAREIRTLVESLEEAGLSESDLALEGVHAEVSSGFLGKSSSARYRLRVRCTELELLPEVLGAITSAKNAQLVSLDWGYPESAEQEGTWLAACTRDARTKASAVANALGGRIAGVREFHDQIVAHETPRHHDHAFAAPAAIGRMRLQESVDVGFEMGNTKEFYVGVTIHFRVEGSEAS